VDNGSCRERAEGGGHSTASCTEGETEWGGGLADGRQCSNAHGQGERG
jgi:hypothetical protein